MGGGDKQQFHGPREGLGLEAGPRALTPGCLFPATHLASPHGGGERLPTAPFLRSRDGNVISERAHSSC